MYDLVTRTTLRVTHNENSFFPDWSPDGKLIAFDKSVSTSTETTGIHIMKADGSQARWILPGMMADWAPDGVQLAFVKGVSVLPGYSHAEIFLSENPPELKQLTFNGDDSGKSGSGTQLVDNIYPSWSPDGCCIAWQHDKEIWTMKADGSHQKKLTQGIQPQWSPDSQQIVFSKYMEDHSGLFMMDKDGSDIRKVTGKHTYMIIDKDKTPSK